MGKGTRSTYLQFLMIAVTFFCAHSSYLIVNAVGGGGLKDSSVSATANFISCIASAAIGLFAGAIHNFLGSRLSLLLGCASYTFFWVAYVIYCLTEFAPILYLAGVLFGLCMTLFWTAQNALMLTYPTGQYKGKYLSTFFLAFAASGVVGGVLILALNFESKGTGLGMTTYYVSIALATLGCGLTLLLKPNGSLIRDDGSPMEEQVFEGWMSELNGVKNIFTNKYIWLLTPVFIVLGMYFTYIANGYNLSLFTMRTRGLNLIFFSVSGMLGSLAQGWYFDNVKLANKPKGLLCAAVIVALMCISWISASFVQAPYTRETDPADIDFQDSFYWSILIIYCIWGILDSGSNSFAMWVLSGVTDDQNELSRFTGYSRCLQGVGGIIAWGMDSVRVPFMVMLWLTFGSLILGMAFAMGTVMVLPFNDKRATMDSISEDMVFVGADGRTTKSKDEKMRLGA